MAFLPMLTKRTCAAFVVGFARQRNSNIPSWTALQSISSSSPNLPSPTPSERSTFRPPAPPTSKGIAVFEDIDLLDEGAAIESSNDNVTKRNSDLDAVFVVTGASRGIGLQFVKTLVTHTKGKIVACYRNIDKVQDLRDLLETLDPVDEKRITTVQLDLEVQESVARAGKEIRSNFDRVDMLLNVAGLLGNPEINPGPEKSINKINRDWMEKAFSVNVIGPIMFTQELTPLLAQKPTTPKAKSSENENDEDSRAPAVVVNLSARVGSISDNLMGGWYSYRTSKAALNQATRTMAHELKRQSVWCVALQPGTTDTDLSKPYQKNVKDSRLFPPWFTVESLLKVVDSMDEEHSGGLYDWAGKSIPF